MNKRSLMEISEEKINNWTTNWKIINEKCAMKKAGMQKIIIWLIKLVSLIYKALIINHRNINILPGKKV